MRLQKLIINNFKGIKHFVLDAQGANASIYADNALGKTTIADAFLWLLFDKDSQNKKDFAIKTLDHDGNEMHGLEHDVEGILVHHGIEKSFRKVYTEQWTKKRGSASPVFSGHTTDHYIDGVPVKKNEYVTRIKLIAEEAIFKLLTSPTYFNEQLTWQDRRQILLSVCGDITDEDVIASDAALAGLPAILNNRTLEDYRKIIASRRTKINDELKQIPIRVSEVQRGLPDLAGLDAKKIAAEITSLQSQIKAKEQEISRIESGSEITEKQNQIRTVEGELITLKNQIQGQISEQIDAKRREQQKIKSQLFEAQTAAKNKQTTLDNNQKQIKQYTADIEGLRNKWHQRNDQQFTYEQSNICPTCGQDLPSDQLIAARERPWPISTGQKLNTLRISRQMARRAKIRWKIYRLHPRRCVRKFQNMKTWLTS